MKIKQNLLLLSITSLAFLRAASGFGFGMALPLYYYGKIEESLIGFVVAATALAYLFSPYLFRNAYKKIGMKTCMLISCLGFVIVQIGIQFFIDIPIIIYIFLFCDGVVLGIFWPVISGIFTVIVSQVNDELKKNKLNRMFGLSWNIGGIFGYLLSAFALFIMSDILLVFDISLIYTIIGLIIAISLKEPQTNFGEEKAFKKENSNPDSETTWKFPVYVPLLMALLFGLIVGAWGVMYPVKSKVLNFSDFSAYVVSFVRMIIQTTCISYALVLPVRKLKKSIPFLMLITLIGMVVIGFAQDLITCIIIAGILGAFIGFCHAFGFRLTIYKNLERNDMKATTYFETTLGINFWLGPIFGGLLADISILLGFSMLAIILLIAMLFFIAVQSKIEIK